MYEDLKVFIKKFLKENERYKDATVYKIDIKICGEWYDYVAYFTKNSRDNITAGSIRIKDFDKQLRREKLKKIKI
jgi:hypothetical protein